MRWREVVPEDQYRRGAGLHVGGRKTPALRRFDAEHIEHVFRHPGADDLLRHVAADRRAGRDDGAERRQALLARAMIEEVELAPRELVPVALGLCRPRVDDTRSRSVAPGSGSSRMPLTRLKTAVAGPSASASVVTAVIVNVLCRQQARGSRGADPSASDRCAAGARAPITSAIVGAPQARSRRRRRRVAAVRRTPPSSRRRTRRGTIRAAPQQQAIRG